MGRNRKPVRVRLLDGTHNEKRDGQPLATLAGLPVKPDWLDETGSKVWDTVVVELAEVDGLLSPLDAPMLSIYCDAWSMYHKAREIIKRDGLLVAGRGGVKVRNPATMIQRLALQTIHEVGAKFGLQPVSRASLAIDPVNTIEPLRRRRNHFDKRDSELEGIIS
jgi:P27 family predicted phage terminase small subunit